MATWNSNKVTNEHLLPYVDAATAPPAIAEALNTLPFERNIFKVHISTYYAISIVLINFSYSPMLRLSSLLS